MQLNIKRKKLFGIIILLVFIFTCIINFFYHNLLPIDDALILERYFRNFRNGYGLYFNINDSLNYGYTSIFGTWINGFISKFFGLDIFTLRFILPSTSLVLIFILNYNLFLKNNFLLSLIPILSPLFLYWSYSGLESYWIVLFIYLSAYFSYKEKDELLAITLGSSFLFRPELIICLLPFFIILIRKLLNGTKIKNKITTIIYITCPLLITTIIILNNYENLIPLSILAKSVSNELSYINFFKTILKNSLGSFDFNFLNLIYYLLIIYIIYPEIYFLKNKILGIRKSSKYIWNLKFFNLIQVDRPQKNINISFVFYILYLILSKAYFPWYFSPLSYWLVFNFSLYLKNLKKNNSIKKILIVILCISYIYSNINIIKITNNFIQDFYINSQMGYINFIKNRIKIGSKIITGASGYSSYFLNEYIVKDQIGLDSLDLIELRKKFPKDFEERALCKKQIDVVVKLGRNKNNQEICKEIRIINLELSDKVKKDYRSWHLLINKNSLKKE